MKIALIGPVYPFRGGIAHHTAQLNAALRARNHQVLLISFRRQYPGWLYPGISDRDPSHPVLSPRAEYLLDPLNPNTWRQTIQRIEDFAPDMVILQWWTTFWSLAFHRLSATLRSRNITVIYLIHNVFPHEQRPWDAPLARLALRQGCRFICQNPHEAQRLRELLPAVEETVCPLPVFPRRTEQNVARSSARERLMISADEQVLLFFGIVRPYKGLRTLLEALAIMRQQGSAPTLIIAGEFWESRRDYQQLIHKLGLTAQVRIDDRYIPDEEADLYFSAAELFVAPYLAGTQSGSVALALGYGLPVIATERIADGVSPEFRDKLVVVKSGDAAALAQAIRSQLDRADNPAPVRPSPKQDWDRLVALIEQYGATSQPSQGKE